MCRKESFRRVRALSSVTVRAAGRPGVPLEGSTMRAQFRVSRWTRGPHDRLYVSTSGNREVGWHDLRTGRESLQLPEMRPEFRIAVERWKREHLGGLASSGSPAPGRPPETARSRLPAAAFSSTTDLASRKAGSGPALRARQLQIRNPLLRGLAAAAGLRAPDRAWRIGAAGEVAVGRRLDRLRKHGWRVLHSVQLGRGGDIDHLVIGPPGVFTVNTKHHPGARVRVGRAVVFVRGNRVDHITQARQEAARARIALTAAAGCPVNVQPLIVIHGANVSGWALRRPQGVKVLPSRAAAWWLRSPGRALLRHDEIEALYATACDPATWRSA